MPDQFAVLDLPCVATKPSINSLQWTDDGQLIYVSKSAAYILTPENIGIQCPSQKVSRPGILDCFRTIIHFDRDGIESWADSSREWGTVALGSFDISLRSLASSPSNLTPTGGCIFALLTSNLDLYLYAASNDPLKGQWVKIHDVTKSLRSLFLEKKKSDSSMVLKTQVTSVAWTKQPEFGITPASRVDASILVIGTRAGSVLFLRYEPISSTVHLLHRIKVADNWVTNLALSSWTPIKSGKCCELTLAYGTPDGSAGLLMITQDLQTTGKFTVFSPDFALQFSCGIPRTIFQEAVSGLTALHWVSTTKANILVKCSPGILDFWSDMSPNCWSGHRSLSLTTENCSVGSSALQPVSGLYYIRSEDALVVSLFDGSVHVVHELSVEPSWTPSVAKDDLMSRRLSQLSRSVFVQASERSVSYRDANRVSGLVSGDDCGVVFWAQDVSRPNDFSYKYEASHRATLIAADLWNAPNDLFLRQLEEILATAKSVSGMTPHQLLRGVMQSLPRHPDLHSRAIQLLVPRNSIDFALPVFSPWSADPGPILRDSFRTSIMRVLFGTDILLSLRMRLYLANALLKAPSEETKDLAGQAACSLTRAISHILLRVLIRFVTPVVNVLEETDAPFVLRLTQCASLPDSPPDLRIEAKTLLDTLLIRVPSAGMQKPIEICPACNEPIPFDGMTHTHCLGGHAWERCSITSYILSTSEVKTCIGCRRKAFLPGCSNLQSWVVEELLQAINRCLFCGNNFVAVV
ncbi:transcription factor IIIC subunit delta N-term-domain-containing protein [Mycena floridula]|nr:transcription factor IIIC subunit delta N-term-domain-containing protein [Mycena floridula]